GTQWQIKSSPFDSVCGTAMANYVMKWTGTELCNSIIYDDGTNVGIGTVTPSYKLHVAGSGYVRDSLRIDGDFRPGGNPGSPGQVLISQGTGVAPQWQTPPQFQSWYLWHVDYWWAGPTDPGPQGWTGATTTNCGGQWLLGGYSQCGTGCVLSKTLTGLPPHSEVMVEVFWWSIDSWDQHRRDGLDTIILYLDNQKISIATPHTPYGWNNALGTSTDNRTSNNSICGNNAIDIGPQVMVGQIAHSQVTLTVDIKNGANQPSRDESLGIQMVRIWLKP
ncbi:MAG: hypothetical protein GXO48_02605, partial [Chlorobi bacterium]|nr:hypothetical protein [Chlorobiota bacterium]